MIIKKTITKLPTKKQLDEANKQWKPAGKSNTKNSAAGKKK